MSDYPSEKLPVFLDVDIAYVRRLGNLPEFPDEILAPHLEGAIRRVESHINNRVPDAVVDIERAKEAVGCFTLAFALPVLNTFYLSQADKVPRQVAQTDYVFHDPGEVVKLTNYWEKRAYEALRNIGRTDGSVSATVI